MKRKLKWTAICLALLLVGFGTVLYLLPRDRITRESWERIRLGMTEKEVEEILGGPGMTFKEFEIRTKALTTLAHDGVIRSEPVGANFNIAGIKYWIGRRGCLRVEMLRGQVIVKYFDGWKFSDPNFIDRLRDWLGW